MPVFGFQLCQLLLVTHLPRLPAHSPASPPCQKGVFGPIPRWVSGWFLSERGFWLWSLEWMVSAPPRPPQGPLGVRGKRFWGISGPEPSVPFQFPTPILRFTNHILPHSYPLCAAITPLLIQGFFNIGTGGLAPGGFLLFSVSDRPTDTDTNTKSGRTK